MIKFFIIAVFLSIIFSLGSALYHLVKHKENNGPSVNIVRALTVRISLSLLLFILVYILVVSGIFRPQGIGHKIHFQNDIQQNPSSPLGQ